MKSQNEQKIANFWFGFLFGAGGAAILAFLMGTTKGRKILKDVIEFSENIEENVVKYIEHVNKNTEDKGFHLDDFIKITGKIKNSPKRA